MCWWFFSFISFVGFSSFAQYLRVSRKAKQKTNTWQVFFAFVRNDLFLGNYVSDSAYQNDVMRWNNVVFYRININWHGPPMSVFGRNFSLSLPFIPFFYLSRSLFLSSAFSFSSFSIIQTFYNFHLKKRMRISIVSLFFYSKFESKYETINCFQFLLWLNTVLFFYHTLNRVMISMVDWCDHAVIVETVIQRNENEWNEKEKKINNHNNSIADESCHLRYCIQISDGCFDIYSVFYSFSPKNKFGQLLLFGLFVRCCCFMPLLHRSHHRQKHGNTSQEEEEEVDKSIWNAKSIAWKCTNTFYDSLILGIW